MSSSNNYRKFAGRYGEGDEDDDATAIVPIVSKRRPEDYESNNIITKDSAIGAAIADDHDNISPTEVTNVSDIPTKSNSLNAVNVTLSSPTYEANDANINHDEEILDDNSPEIPHDANPVVTEVSPNDEQNQDENQDHVSSSLPSPIDHKNRELQSTIDHEARASQPGAVATLSSEANQKEDGPEMMQSTQPQPPTRISAKEKTTSSSAKATKPGAVAVDKDGPEMVPMTESLNSSTTHNGSEKNSAYEEKAAGPGAGAVPCTADKDENDFPEVMQSTEPTTSLDSPSVKIDKNSSDIAKATEPGAVPIDNDGPEIVPLEDSVHSSTLQTENEKERSGIIEKATEPGALAMSSIRDQVGPELIPAEERNNDGPEMVAVENDMSDITRNKKNLVDTHTFLEKEIEKVHAQSGIEPEVEETVGGEEFRDSQARTFRENRIQQELDSDDDSDVVPGANDPCEVRPGAVREAGYLADEYGMNDDDTYLLYNMAEENTIDVENVDESRAAAARPANGALSPSSRNLVEAVPVDENELRDDEDLEQAVVAEELDLEKTKGMKGCIRSHKRLTAFIVFLLVAVVVVGIILSSLGVVGGAPSQVEIFLSQASTRVIQALPIAELTSPRELLVDPTTPQSQALIWLADDDEAQLDFTNADEERIIQRFVLAVMFFSTTRSNWTETYNFLSPSNECEWVGKFSSELVDTVESGVKCNDEGFVTALSLSK
jgi:hypothetical protein